jgi:hypothetical protein
VSSNPLVGPESAARHGNRGMKKGIALSVWTTLDQLMAIPSAAARRGRSEDLVEEIADGLATAGRYATRVDVLATQQAVDFNWAAQQAGRRLGIRIQLEVRRGRTQADDHTEVWVTPQEPPQ